MNTTMLDLVRCGDCGKEKLIDEFAPSNRPKELGGGRRVGRCRVCETRRERRRTDPRHDAAGRSKARKMVRAVLVQVFGDAGDYWLVHHIDGDDRNNDPLNLVVCFGHRRSPHEIQREFIARCPTSGPSVPWGVLAKWNEAYETTAQIPGAVVFTALTGLKDLEDPQ